MDHDTGIDRRKETRYPIEANVTIQRSDGETISGTAANISNSGMLLHLDPPASLNLDEEVTVTVELPDVPDKPFSAWGVARVARVHQGRFGIELFAGTFHARTGIVTSEIS